LGGVKKERTILDMMGGDRERRVKRERRKTNKRRVMGERGG